MLKRPKASSHLASARAILSYVQAFLIGGALLFPVCESGGTGKLRSRRFARECKAKCCLGIRQACKFVGLLGRILSEHLLSCGKTLPNAFESSNHLAFLDEHGADTNLASTRR